MAVFGDLPNEIIIEIITCLYNSGYRGSSRSINSPLNPKYLLNLCLTSHLLHALCEPLLYRSVTIGQWDHIRRKKLTPWAFLRSVLSRPSLAAHVHTLNIQWARDRDDVRKGLTPAQLSTESKLFTTAAEKTNLPLSKESQEDQVILLLHLLPRLQSLGVLPPPQSHWLESFLSNIDPSDPTGLALGLKNLQRFLHIPSNSGGATHISRLQHVFSLPRICSISAYHVNGDCYDSYLAGTAPASSVTELKFLDSDIRGDDLALILGATSQLTHFEYEDAGGRINARDFDGESFGRGLQCVKATLQNLRLNLELATTRQSGRLDIGSLRAFPVLRRVSCSLDAFVRAQVLAEVLPEALEELTLRYGSIGKPSLKVLVGLLDRKETCLPRLRVVRLHGRVIQDQPYEEVLREKSKMVGVRFAVSTRAGTFLFRFL